MCACNGVSDSSYVYDCKVADSSGCVYVNCVDVVAGAEYVYVVSKFRISDGE